LEVVSRAIEKRRQRLEVSSATVPVPVFGDEARLRQIQENLLTNASKYTPDGGRIRVELHHCGGEALIRISDTGRGIDAENLESIFDLFTQGPSELDRSDGGMGVGLTLVRILVGMHGGSVRALSDGRDRGSTMEVRIPIAAALEETDSQGDADVDAPSEQPSVSTEILQQRPTPLDIVLVEDNDDAREMLQLLLEVEGHRVRAAADGLAGLNVISR